MALTVSYTASQPFRRVPGGVWPARCISVIDLGTQENTYQGETKLQHQIMFTYEVYGEDEAGVPLTVEGLDGVERPLQISTGRMTLSLSEKANLRKFLDQWRGKPMTAEELKGFDLSKVLGAPCMVNVQEYTNKDGKERSRIVSITPLPASMKKVLPANDTPHLMFDTSDWDGEVFESLPEYIQNIIKESAEYKARQANPAPAPAAATAPAGGNAMADLEADVPW